MSNIFIIKKPWVTEKSVGLSKMGKYVFIVEPHISKSEIKKALKKSYGVDAVSVNVVNIPGKKKRMGRSITKTSGMRKAIVTLKSGQSLDIIPQ